MLNKIIRYFLENKLITFMLLAAFIIGGIVTAPFNWETSWIERNPVPVDAIPDIAKISKSYLPNGWGNRLRMWKTRSLIR